MNDPLIFRALRTISQLETPGGPVSSAYVARVIGESYRDTKLALSAAEYDELVWFDRCGYRLTSVGSEALAEVRTADYLYADEERRWKREVLTGLDSDGEPSSIDRAVLPTNEKHASKADQDFWADVLRKLARIGITRENIDRVRVCQRCWQLYLLDRGCCDDKK